MPKCYDCKTTKEHRLIGCCNDGDCPKKIENMCDICSTWDEDNEVWLCKYCVEL